MNKFFILFGGLVLTFSLLGCQNEETTTVSEQSNTTPAPISSSSEVVATQESNTPAVSPSLSLEVAVKTQETKKESPPTTPIPPKDSTPQKNKTATVPVSKEALKGITIRADGFAPSNITITPGTKVIFINMDDNLHWPASGVHPTHQICPSFDALKGLAKNETYTFTFTEAKTCPFHDHLNPSMKGTIAVK